MHNNKALEPQNKLGSAERLGGEQLLTYLKCLSAYIKLEKRSALDSDEIILMSKYLLSYLRILIKAEILAMNSEGPLTSQHLETLITNLTKDPSTITSKIISSVEEDFKEDASKELTSKLMKTCPNLTLNMIREAETEAKNSSSNEKNLISLLEKLISHYPFSELQESPLNSVQGEQNLGDMDPEAHINFSPEEIENALDGFFYSGTNLAQNLQQLGAFPSEFPSADSSVATDLNEGVKLAPLTAGRNSR